MMTLVSLFGNSGLFRPHPTGKEHQSECCIIDTKVMNPQVAELQSRVPALVLPRAGTWVTHRQDHPNILWHIGQKYQWSYLNALNQANELQYQICS
jgi:hypothetical protein